MDVITDSVNMSLSKVWEMVKDREVSHAAVYGVTKSVTEQLKNNHINIIVGRYYKGREPQLSAL